MFADRADAGRRLAPLLEHLRDDDVVVLGLPRGGVVVAAGVAEHLGAPLDVLVVRKLGAPWQPELALGAIGEGGVRVVNDDVLLAHGGRDLDAIEARERAELDRRVAVFRSVRPAEPIAGRVAVVVDDGLATGATAAAALQVARGRDAARVVLAVPVASPATLARMRDLADEVIAIDAPHDLRAVGLHYRDFTQVSDDVVLSVLTPAFRAEYRQNDQDGSL